MNRNLVVVTTMLVLTLITPLFSTEVLGYSRDTTIQLFGTIADPTRNLLVNGTSFSIGGTNVMLTGVNIILWENSDTRYKTVYFTQLKNLGYNTVVVNFGWNFLEPTKNTYDQNYLGLMDRLIAKIESQGLYVILRMHKWGYPSAYQATDISNHYILGYPAWLRNTPDFWENYSGCWTNYINMWTNLANRYKNDSYVSGFNLMNEPCCTDIYKLGF
jgi:aryl-phospho-beta-D-glucosidase BglC (GH1 family)